MPGLKTKMNTIATNAPPISHVGLNAIVLPSGVSVVYCSTGRGAYRNPAASVPSLPERAESQIRGPAITGDAPQRRA
jgi:hypothetical protein